MKWFIIGFIFGILFYSLLEATFPPSLNNPYEIEVRDPVEAFE